MEALPFLRDLTVVLSSAAAALLLFKRFKLPPVLGYLAAGLLLGPQSPAVALVSDLGTLKALAQLGVVFLLFALGVEFNLKRLAKVGARALVCAGLEAAVMLGLGYALGMALGLRPIGALLLGGISALASTAIVARILLEHGGRGAQWEELSSGVLIAEDILAVLLIAFFSSAGQMGAFHLLGLIEQLFRFGILVTVILVSGLLLLPGVNALVERSGMREVRTLVIVGTCFGVSYVTEALGFSAALGAFLAGAMMYETASAFRLKETIEPFKEVFGAVFFVAVGMLIDPSWILEHWRLALGLTAFLALARFFANFLALAAVGEGKAALLPASLSRLPVGEFSFILAQIGDRHLMTDWPLYPFAVLLCLGTTTAAASLLPAVEARREALERRFPVWLDRLLAEYHGAVRRLAVPKRMRIVLQLVQPSLLQIVLNLLGLSGLFLAANWIQARYLFDARLPGVVWMATAFVSLPFVLALWRKAQAVALIFLEDITTRGDDPRPPAETHPAMTRFLLGLTTVLVAWWYLSLSLTLLPPWPFALAPLAIMAGAGAFVWRRMNRLYARIQAALRDALAEGRAKPEASATVVAHLVEAQSAARVHIVSFRLSKDAASAGKTILELALRSHTGASIVQINRGSEANSSPSPQIHLQAGDEILLVGEHAQIEAAKQLLERGPRAS